MDSTTSFFCICVTCVASRSLSHLQHDTPKLSLAAPQHVVGDFGLHGIVNYLNVP